MAAQSNPTFNTGDVVIPKMGGPKMTVESVSIEPPGYVRCAWFDDASVLHRDRFPDRALSHVVTAP